MCRQCVIAGWGANLHARRRIREGWVARYRQPKKSAACGMQPSPEVVYSGRCSGKETASKSNGFGAITGRSVSSPLSSFGIRPEYD